MTESKKRIALKPHMKEIREWVDEGKADDWIANALGTSASSVQSFRSRNDIYRRERGHREPEKVFEGVLDHGERDGWGLWLDPSVAEDPIWLEHWSDVDAVIVKIAEDSIVLEIDRDGVALDGQGDSADAIVTSIPLASADEIHSEVPLPDGIGESPESGRVKWFDAEKGYGFLVRSTGEDLFVHHSEVRGDPSALEPGTGVQYEVGQNDRGPNARSVQVVE